MNGSEATAYLDLTGIVDRVEAKRRKSGDIEEVYALEATIRVEFGEDYKVQYSDTAVRNYPVLLPPTTKVNPGDVVTISFGVARPRGQRFQLALDIGEAS
jgi:hypothetical protein